MAKTKILNLKTLMDSSDVSSKIQQIQKSLSQLKLPDSLATGFSQTFKELEKAVASFQDKMSVKGKNKDFKGIDKDLTNVTTLVKQLDKQIEDLSSKSNFQKIFKGMDFSEVKQASAAVDELQHKLTQNIGVENIRSVATEIERLHQVSKNKDIDKFFAAFKAGNVDEAREALENLYKTQNRFSQEKRPVFLSGLESLKTLLNNLASNAALPQIRKDLDAANAALTKVRSDKMDELDTHLQSVQKDAHGTAEALLETAGASEKAVESERELGSEIDTLGNRVKYFFGLTNSVLLFRRAIQSAFNTIKELDAAMTDIAVVTDFSVGDMWEQLPEYTANANALGVATKDMINAANLYYHQGRVLVRKQNSRSSCKRKSKIPAIYLTAGQP